MDIVLIHAADNRRPAQMEQRPILETKRFARGQLVAPIARFVVVEIGQAERIRRHQAVVPNMPVGRETEVRGIVQNRDAGDSRADGAAVVAPRRPLPPTLGLADGAIRQRNRPRRRAVHAGRHADGADAGAREEGASRSNSILAQFMSPGQDEIAFPSIFFLRFLPVKLNLEEPVR